MENLEVIQAKIYHLRGQKVMFDFDLAELYGTETGQLKRAVRRNIERFEGEDFMLEVTREELSRCQIGTLNKGRGGNIKYLPFAFTELGVAMLSSVLNSKAAIEINRGIMRAFVAVRNMISESPHDKASLIDERIHELKKDMDEFFACQNDINEDTRMQLDLINETLAELQVRNREMKPRKIIGYEIPNNENNNV